MTGNESLPAGMALRREPEGLVLTADGMSLRADFSRLLPRLEPRRLGRELLLRATRIRGCDRGLRAVDATAGLGEDSLLLAAAGFEVTLFERNSVIAALLADALERASREPELAEIVSRMRACFNNFSCSFMFINLKAGFWGEIERSNDWGLREKSDEPFITSLQNE